MRILIISGSIPPMKCGIGDYTAQLALALGKRPDTTVAVLTDVAATGTTIAEGYFEVLPVAHGWRMRDAWPIIQAVRRWRPDVVHIQYPTQGYGLRKLPWLLPAFLSGLRLPVIQTWHEYYRTVRGMGWHLLNLLWPGSVVVVRPNYRSALAPWLQRLAWGKHFHFIPNASAIPAVQLNAANRLAVRAKFLAPPSQLIVYFGFAYPEKGMDLLFKIADPALHHLVIVGSLDPANPYHQQILEESRQPRWIKRVTVTGFLSASEAARVLAAADAVVLPFRSGGGPWNTSLQAAVIQGTFVLTTSVERQGYSATENVYYAQPHNLVEMQQALQRYAGRRSPPNGTGPFVDWGSIAEQHAQLYRQAVGD